MTRLEDIKERLYAGVPAMTILIHAKPRTQPDYRTGFEQRGDDIAFLLAEVERLQSGVRSLGDHLYTYQDGLIWLREEANRDTGKADTALCCLVSMVSRDGPRWDGDKGAVVTSVGPELHESKRDA